LDFLTPFPSLDLHSVLQAWRRKYIPATCMLMGRPREVKARSDAPALPYGIAGDLGE